MLGFAGLLGHGTIKLIKCAGLVLPLLLFSRWLALLLFTAGLALLLFTAGLALLLFTAWVGPVAVRRFAVPVVVRLFAVPVVVRRFAVPVAIRRFAVPVPVHRLAGSLVETGLAVGHWAPHSAGGSLAHFVGHLVRCFAGSFACWFLSRIGMDSILRAFQQACSAASLICSDALATSRLA